MQLQHHTEVGPLPRNEDKIFVAEAVPCALVADGLSVKAGGDWAAEYLGQEFTAELQKSAGTLASLRMHSPKEIKAQLEKVVDALVQRISKKIFEEGSKRPDLTGMCTGFDSVLQVAGHLFVAHVGAGRVYLIRRGEAHLLTEDHTQLAHLKRIGKLDKVSPQDQQLFARRVTRAVGFQESVKVDYLILELEKGDRIACVTDGIWQTLGDATTANTLSIAEEAKSVVEKIMGLVQETGPKDNFSALLWQPDLQSAGAESDSADQKLKMLGRIPAFQYLSYQELVKLISFGELNKVAAGQELCKEGDPGGEMMLILNGNALVRKSGKEIGRLAKGDVFGEMSMIDAAPRSATVVATMATNVLAFPRKELFQLFQEDSALAVKFLWGVTLEMNKRLREASSKLVGKSETEWTPSAKDAILPFVKDL
jgi:serine/threonine protein phosphatase PrpC